jgi:predicted dehydrogenase
MNNWTRRDFLKSSILTGSAAVFAKGRLYGAVGKGNSPNETVRVAVTGCRGKGAQHISMFRTLSNVQLAALCDVDSTVLDGHVKKLGEKGDKPATFRDYRKLLEDKSIDAVVIATPNHWHALMAIWACQAGKDVYVEKPCCHNLFEGRKLVEAAAKYKRMVQHGTQSRSDEALQQVFQFIREGNLGKIKWARGLCYKPRPSIGKTTGPQPIPKEIDYDLWCGPAPLEPLRREKLHYDWHWFWATGNADIGNQGVHEMDMARWALGQQGLPPKVMAIGGRFGYEDDAETPNTQIAVYLYEPAPLIFEVRGLPRKAGDTAMDAYRNIRVGCVVQCENGYFAGGAGGGWIFDKDGQRTKQFVSKGGGGHQENFINACRSRKVSDLNAPVTEGFLSAALCHLGNIPYRVGTDTANDDIKEAVKACAETTDSFQRVLDHMTANDVDIKKTPSVLSPVMDFDPVKEKFISKAKYDLGFWANRLTTREYRRPYIVPEKV